MNEKELRDDKTAMHAVFGRPVYVYSRADALEDGLLVDVTETATEAGFRVPVAMTAAAWGVVAVRSNTWEDTKGKLWDVLFTLFFTVRTQQRDASAICWNIQLSGKSQTFRAVIGPGDDGEAVITIMLPGED